jgi:hypothetical protein
MKVETEFKVLTHDGRFVDAIKLCDGIYYCEIPYLISKEHSIGRMLEMGRKINEEEGEAVIGNGWFENLRKCELVRVKIGFI